MGSDGISDWCVWQWISAHLFDASRALWLVDACFTGTVSTISLSSPSSLSPLSPSSLRRNSNTHLSSSSVAAHLSSSFGPWLDAPTPHHPNVKISKKKPFWLPFFISLQSKSTASLGGSLERVIVVLLSLVRTHHLGWRPAYHTSQPLPKLQTKWVTSGISLRRQCLLSQLWTVSGQCLLLSVCFFLYHYECISITAYWLYNNRKCTFPSGYSSKSSSSSQSQMVWCQIRPWIMSSSARTHGAIHLGHFWWLGCVVVNEGTLMMSLASAGIKWGVGLIGRPKDMLCCTEPMVEEGEWAAGGWNEGGEGTQGGEGIRSTGVQDGDMGSAWGEDDGCYGSTWWELRSVNSDPRW